MSNTPRTDAEAEHCDNVSLWCNTGKHGYSAEKNATVVPVEFARTLERELEQEKKWKDEDPRMLRDQIRVADAAFNGLNERHNAALAEIESWTRRHKAVSDERDKVIQSVEAMNKSAPLTQGHREALADYATTYLQRGIQGVWYDLATGIATLLNHCEQLQAQLAECQAARARLSDPVVDPRNDMEPI